MKLKVFLVLLVGVLSLNVSSLAFANGNAYEKAKIETIDILEQSRVYFAPEQIHIDFEGIFVEIEGNIYQVSQLCQDENGFYVTNTAFWKICPYGHPNPPWRLRCKVCKTPL